VTPTKCTLEKKQITGRNLTTRAGLSPTAIMATVIRDKGIARSHSTKRYCDFIWEKEGKNDLVGSLYVTDSQ